MGTKLVPSQRQFSLPEVCNGKKLPSHFTDLLENNLTFLDAKTTNLIILIGNADSSVMARILRLTGLRIKVPHVTDWGDRTTVKPENFYTPTFSDSMYAPASLFSRVALADDRKCPICGIRHEAPESPLPRAQQSAGSPSNR